MIIEVCLDSLSSVAAAAEAGAARIELCAALTEGGLTPSLGTLRRARELFPGIIVMMIRPRAGDFFYSMDELAAMEMDILTARDHGADECVFGCLRSNGTIDESACERLLSAAAGMPCVFHRAFDVSADLSTSLETVIRLGFHRVLTSGGAPAASEGAETLAALIHQAGKRIQILPGGGITGANAADLLARTGATQLHLTGRHTLPSPMEFRKPDIPMGAHAVPGEYVRHVTDPAIIRNLVALSH